MECECAVEKVAAEVLESVLVFVCSRDGSIDRSRFQDHSQCFSLASTSRTLDSCDYLESGSNDADARFSELNALVNSTPQSSSHVVATQSKMKKSMQLITIADGAKKTSYITDEDSPPCSDHNVTYKECHVLIKEVLESFDEKTDENCLVDSDSESIQREPVSIFPAPNRQNSSMESPTFELGYSVESTPKELAKTEDVSLSEGEGHSFEVSHGAIEEKESGCEGLFENFEFEIEQMVNQMLSNNTRNAEQRKEKTSKTFKSKPHPTLQVIDHTAAHEKETKDLATPECSDDFAELNLNLKTESADSSASTTAIPLGWLNTMTNRKQNRNNTTSLQKHKARTENFVYCGPSEENNRDLENKDMPPTQCISCLKVRTPETSCDIPIELLYSGVAFTPDAYDKDGSPLLVILCDEVIWQKGNVGPISLARLLLYLTLRLTKVTFLLDYFNSSATLLQNLFEALSIFQNNSPISVSGILLLFFDHDDTARVVLKSLFDCQCFCLQSIEDLTSHIDTSDLLTQYGGTLAYSHTDWAQSRLVVDGFVSFCENIRHNFARETMAMTSHSLPGTVKESRALLTQHKKDMGQLLDDRQLSNLRERCQRILQQLEQNGRDDAELYAELVHSSYNSANGAVTRFVQAADERLLSLEQHLLVKQFEQSCNYIHHSYSTICKILAEQFEEIPESFEALRNQRGAFENFYIYAMTEYAKCDCILTEVEQLNQLGYLREERLTEKAKISQKQVKDLVSKMEGKKEEIEVTTQMYKFIDQAYSWALEGMKFVAMLNMDESLTYEACQQMLERFDSYMESHPVISEEDFAGMEQLCRRYGNNKCLQQCEFAQQKCRETCDLFQKRRELITKAMAQYKRNGKKRFGTLRKKPRERADNSLQGHAISPVRCNSSILSSSSTTTNCSDSRPASLRCDSSIETLSTHSADSSVFDESCAAASVSSASSSTFNTESTDTGYSSKLIPKPARKILKKSSSVPNHQLAQQRTMSHLQSHSGVTLTIGSPVREEEADTSGKSKIALIIEELISTEKEYVRSLNYVIENYFPEMCRLDIPQTLRCKRNIIFGNIEKIFEFHSGCFLTDLESCDGNPLLIAKAFQKHKESFGLYALYSKNKPQSDQLLQEHGNEFFKAKQLELGDKMDLASYLLKPVQRMGKYALLLHGMSKHSSSSDERSLRDAEELVKFQLRHGNDLLTMDSIRDCDVNLKEQGNLLRQEQFMIYCGRRKFVRRVFLFEDLILFSKPIHVHGGHDVYQYKCSYKTAEIGLTENIGDSGFKFEIWFRRLRPQATQDRFVLQSVSRNVKRSWVEEIRGLLWKQALRNRDHRKLEMSSMGVGNKPHLELTASSENRITDRSVLTTPPGDRNLLADRLASSRSRASVAVSSFDHVLQQSKRPHSAISTSSSTSSVGSGNNQSGSLISSLNLASWPSKADVKSAYAFTPPLAYYDFHAIAEDKNEDSENSSDSSLLTSQDEASDTRSKSPVARQYVTTTNHQLLVK